MNLGKLSTKYTRMQLFTTKCPAFGPPILIFQEGSDKKRSFLVNVDINHNLIELSMIIEWFELLPCIFNAFFVQKLCYTFCINLTLTIIWSNAQYNITHFPYFLLSKDQIIEPHARLKKDILSYLCPFSHKSDINSSLHALETY